MPGATAFDPDRDIPSLEGKVIFVTGGTAGLGRESILRLAKHSPSHILFSGRNAAASASLIDAVRSIDPSVRTTFVQMDLSSLASVRAAALSILPSLPRLDLLLCNAGVMVPTPRLSEDGFEVHFATNHLGHAMLIRHLLPLLLSTAAQPSSDVRVVILTSKGWRGHPADMISYHRLRSLKPHYASFLGRWLAYCQSKFANLLYAAELARRHPSLLTVSVHPGVVETGLIGTLGWGDRAFIYGTNRLTRVPILGVEEGAHCQLYVSAAAERGELVNGAFYMPVGQMRNDMLSKKESDPAVAAKLWEWTEEVLDKVN